MYPKDRYEWYVLLAAGACILLGAISSILLSDWQWLERSGSLVVIVALCFFWRDRVARDEELIQGFIDTQKECEEKLEPLRTPEDIQNKKLVFYYRVDEAKAEEGIKNMKNRYTNIEVGLGVFGTFIWGFGNPLASFIYSLCASA